VSCSRRAQGKRGSARTRRTCAQEVAVKVVSGEPEAEIACGLLRSAGIECFYRETEEIDSPLEDFIAAGERET
jgi:hypothetical protein